MKKYKRFIIDKEKFFISLFSYWFVVLSIIISIWQLFDFCFDIFIPYPYNIIAIIDAVLLSIITSFVAALYLPSIFDVLFHKKTEEEKFFGDSENNEIECYKATLYMSLPYLNDDRALLKSFEDLFRKKDEPTYNLDKALQVARVNSSLFVKLDKHLYRVLNGIYALYCLQLKAIENSSFKRKRFDYLTSFFLVNDIGWSLSKLDNDEYERLKKVLSEEKNVTILAQVSELEISKDFFFNNESAKKASTNLLVRMMKKLKSEGKYPKLTAQAIRHCLSFEEIRVDNTTLDTDLEEAIQKLSNTKDKNEMKGNYEYLCAKLCYRSILKTGVNDVVEGLSHVDKALKFYEDIGDESKAAKCYNLKGNLLEIEYDANPKSTERYLEMINAYKTGLSKSYKALRYDQVLKNLKSLVKTLKDSDELDKAARKMYAKQGRNLSYELNNKDDELFFSEFLEIKHVFFVRHGESTKNVKRIIGGEGDLTNAGKAQMNNVSSQILLYLKRKEIPASEIAIYATEKRQVLQSAEIIRNAINDEYGSKVKIRYENELLKPIYLGDLDGKRESSLVDEEGSPINILDKWRNGTLPAAELDIDGIDNFNDFIKRGLNFIEEKIFNSEERTVIVLCTTSISILLIQCMLNHDIDPASYYSLDIPLGGIAHFVQITDRLYKLSNRDYRTNINFGSVRSNKKVDYYE